MFKLINLKESISHFNESDKPFAISYEETEYSKNCEEDCWDSWECECPTFSSSVVKTLNVFTTEVKLVYPSKTKILAISLNYLTENFVYVSIIKIFTIKDHRGRNYRVCYLQSNNGLTLWLNDDNELCWVKEEECKKIDFVNESFQAQSADDYISILSTVVSRLPRKVTLCNINRNFFEVTNKTSGVNPFVHKI